MARYHGQKALYEVMHKTGLKPAGPVGPVRPAVASDPQQEPAGPVGPVRPVVVSDPQQEPAGPVVDDPALDQLPPSPGVRWHQPRWIQFNAGRVELTIPYPIAVAVVLALILIIVAAYRWGQR